MGPHGAVLLWLTLTLHVVTIATELKGRFCYCYTSAITQYGSTAYLGMTRVVSGQFPCIENVRHGNMAKRDREEPKEHHNLTKGELCYTLIPALHT